MKKRIFTLFVTIVTTAFCMFATELSFKDIDSLVNNTDYQSVLKSLEKIGFSEIKNETRTSLTTKIPNGTFEKVMVVTELINFTKTSDSLCYGEFSYVLEDFSQTIQKGSLVKYSFIWYTTNKQIYDTVYSYSTQNGFEYIEELEWYVKQDCQVIFLFTEKNGNYFIEIKYDSEHF